jgi:hypothetical protein
MVGENPRKEEPMHSRPLPVIIAAALLALFSLLILTLPLFVASMIPAAVLYLGGTLGVAGLVAAGGLWTLKKWGFWLTIVTCAINILWAAPGLTVMLTTPLSAPLARSDPGVLVGFVLSLITVPAFVLVIALAMLPSSRRAYR